MKKHIITLLLVGMFAGAYMLRVTDGEGKEYGRKVVKR